MSSQFGELRPTSGWDRLASLGHPSKFRWVSLIGFFTALTSLNGGEPNVAWCLAVSLARTVYIYMIGGSCPLVEFCQVQNSICVHKKVLWCLCDCSCRLSSWWSTQRIWPATVVQEELLLIWRASLVMNRSVVAMWVLACKCQIFKIISGFVAAAGPVSVVSLKKLHLLVS